MKMISVRFEVGSDIRGMTTLNIVTTSLRVRLPFLEVSREFMFVYFRYLANHPPV